MSDSLSAVSLALGVFLASGLLAAMIALLVDARDRYLRHREREARRIRDANLARFNIVPFKGTRKWHQ